MLKNKKTIFFVLLVSLLTITSSCFAATVSSEKAKLEIVENNVCTIKINDYASFEKKIINYNLEKKELDLQLKVSNNAEPIENPPFEIVMVIDNSLSMKENQVSAGVTRLKQVTDSAKTLATKLLQKENTKIAVVSFSTGDNEGTLSDAILRNSLTSDSNTVLSSINTIATDDAQGPRTDIDAGLQVAKTCFSNENNNKYIILLTDGIPNTAVGGPTFTYSAGTATKTIATLQSLTDSGINIVSAMIGLNATVIEPTTTLSYKSLSEEIFGTPEEPAFGKFYYVSDDNIEQYICTTIFNNIIDTTMNTLTNLKIYDYFPQEIVNNFDFSYVTSPTKGTVSPDIDLQNNMIVWTISELAPKETATVSYKLKLKDKIDTSIVSVILNTNEKVDITADKIETPDGSNILTSDVSPKVRVTMPEDPTVINTVIPQTGDTNIIGNIIITILIVSALVFGIRFYIINKN